MSDPSDGPPPDGDAVPDPLARMADDLERIAAHLVPFLKSSYTDTVDRLTRAERIIASRQERPAIAGLHRVLCSVRRLDAGEDVHGFVEESLVGLLANLGYEEFGRAGESYDPARHEPVAGQTDRGRGQVSRVHRRGLACAGDVIIRAVVEVSPDEAPSGFDFEVVASDAAERRR